MNPQYLRVQLFNIRFNSIIQKGPYNVILYKLNEAEDSVEGTCLDHLELTKLSNYVASNKENFGYSSYHNCDPEESPEMNEYNFYPIDSGFPEFLTIRKANKIKPSNGDIYRWMDVELLKSNGSTNNLSSLPFELVCKIER